MPKDYNCNEIFSIFSIFTGLWLIAVIYLLKKLTCINMKDYNNNNIIIIIIITANCTLYFST